MNHKKTIRLLHLKHIPGNVINNEPGNNIVAMIIAGEIYDFSPQ
jgi:hypothetical protein